jgi:hypothetical protein
MSATPNLEERLASAAFTILTDDQPHELAARVWATRFIRAAAHGSRTAFQSAISAQCAMRDFRDLRDFRDVARIGAQ